MNEHRLQQELFFPEPPCVNLSGSQPFLIKHSSSMLREASAPLAGVEDAPPLTADSQRSEGTGGDASCAARRVL